MSRPDRIVVSLGNGGGGGSWPGFSGPQPLPPPQSVTLLSIDFSGVTPGAFSSFPAGLSLLRSSDAGYEVSGGFKPSVGGNDIARVAFLGSTSALRIERSETNIAQNSTTLTANGWSGDATITAGQTGPDGATGAYRVQRNTSTQGPFVTSATSFPSGPVTFATWVKPNTQNNYQQQLFVAGTTLAAGTTSLAAGWNRFVSTHTVGGNTGIIALCVAFDRSSNGGISAVTEDVFVEYPWVANGLHARSWHVSTAAGDILQDTASAPLISGRAAVRVGWRPDISQATAAADGRTRFRVVGIPDGLSWIDVDTARQYVVLNVDGVRSVLGGFASIPAWNALDSHLFDIEGWGGGTPTGTLSTNGGGAFSIGSGSAMLPYLRTESDTVLNWFADNSRNLQLQGGITSMRLDALTGAAGGPAFKIYASGNGSGTGSKASPASLTGALARARMLLPATVDIVLMDTGGPYYLVTMGGTLAFTQADNGIRLVNYPGQSPVISGGTVVTGWADDGSSRGVQIASFATPTRGLWIGSSSTRATIAWKRVAASGWTKISGGFTIDGTNAAALAGDAKTDIHDVWISGFNAWRWCAGNISTLVSTTLQFGATFWTNSQSNSAFPLNAPEAINNANYLLTGAGGSAGWWCQNRTTGKLYYQGDLSSTLAVAGTLTTLVTVTGTRTTPCTVSLTGITLSHTTYAEPDASGYASLQAGVTGFQGAGSPPWAVHKMTAAYIANYVTGRVLSGCKFQHLEGAAVDLNQGVQSAFVSGCSFVDVGGAPMFIGDVGASASSPSSAADQIDSLLVQDCTFGDCGTSYPDCVSLFFTYVSRTKVLHNLFTTTHCISHIQCGYGFGLQVASPLSVSSANEVGWNSFSGSRQPVPGTTDTLADFGTVYFNARADGSTCHDNYIIPESHDFGALYLDARTQGWTITSNVVNGSCPWAFVTPASGFEALSNTLTGNFWVGAVLNNGSPPPDASNVVTPNTNSISGAQALQIKAYAGTQ